MTSRLARAAYVTAAVAAVTSCSAGLPAAHPSSSAAVSPSPSPRADVTLGAAGCHPASPISLGALGFQVQGTGRGASLWGLLMFRHWPARAGEQDKIVWRMTGSGELRLTATGPDGRHHLAWGPEAHGGSNWDKPGDEWGAGYLFTVPGCWDLHAVRGHATADVWLRVARR